MKKSANKTVYVDLWLTLKGEPHNDGVTATKLPNGKWACEINLPLVNQTVKAVATTEINAMANASDKAVPLIEKYLTEHPEVKFRARSTVRHYEFFTDENGFAGFGQNSEYRKKCGMDMLKMNQDSAKAVERAVARIKKINGTDNNLFIQVLDKRFFKEDATIEDIQYLIKDKILGDSCDYFISCMGKGLESSTIFTLTYIFSGSGVQCTSAHFAFENRHIVPLSRLFFKIYTIIP